MTTKAADEAPVLATTPASPQSSPSQTFSTERAPRRAAEEKVVAKPAQERVPPLGLEMPQPSSGLKRALGEYPQAPQKRPRLASGEVAAWDVEFKTLLSWLETNLSNYGAFHHSKPGVLALKCTDERLGELERWWQHLCEAR